MENNIEITMKAKGGNSPIRFFLYLNGVKIGMAKRGNRRSWEKDLWTVDVYDRKYIKQIEKYLFEIQKIERFYWGSISY